MYLNRILICKFCFYFACLISVAFSDGDSIETWIGADDLHKIDINMTTESVRGVLGDPLFIESALDDDTFYSLKLIALPILERFGLDLLTKLRVFVYLEL